ncbi:polypeptide N-acetylgalactosaminyltransferase 5 [Synchiropus splendidus]|uniref:polypeptide N-acetylgalactosaminyltransferase 5 n=1 Tax=Synchiropus splendidus TaxID=270530 RepID=UPI00237E4511|nr:polypeptide N-acetylgalactosaminyltransferase 5 [Synchiropus splendidus]
MRMRRYLRGSGRALAFVFIASVIWLLFDMAALRLSISDVNTQLLKERVLREKELFRLQTQPMFKRRGGFKHPLQRAKMFMTPAARKTVTSRGQGADADRPARQDQIELAVKANRFAVSDLLKYSRPVKSVNNSVVKKEPTVPKAPAVLSFVTMQPVFVRDQPEKMDFKNDSVVKKEVEKKEVSVGTIRPRLKEAHPANTTQKKDARGPVDIREEQDRNRTLARSERGTLPKPVIPTQKSQLPKINTTGDGGVHKVLSLDVTHAPRDANAVGQFGQAAVAALEENSQVKKRWNEGHFNVYLSEKIPVERAIPDTRPEICSQNLVHNKLPSTSVIFCFVDEVWSTLLRSVHSVLNRSPPHLLEEIILVDDFSTKDYLKQQLDDYMSKLPKVRIIRLKERQGLIRARLAGAAAAKGEVLTFLDSHVECNVGWLEPLLERIYLDRKKVPCPVIEVISDKDMSYMLVDNFQRGIFKWPLVFGWSALPADYIKKNNLSIADPIRCPVMAGGLFSIDKKYFYELGAYDPGLDVWGGENMEISFKIWMCGGEIEIIPCSRVGHIFRGQNPYKFPKDRQKTVERNLARVAEVWLDEYKDLFYGHGYHHLLDKNVIDIGNLTDQMALRKKLNCKSFKWYLENIYPDMHAPLVQAQGLVFNFGLRKCLALEKGLLSFQTCDLSQQSQTFNYTWMRHLRQQDVCVAHLTKDNSLALQSCDNVNVEVRWLHKSSSALVEHIVAETSSRFRCLQAVPQGELLILGACNPNDAFQKWQFTQYHSTE